MKNFLLFTLIVNLTFSQEKDIFVTANERYNAGDFSLAIEKYHEILINGNHSSDLYFNLGNAYYKVDSLASAIYYYEKGLKFYPNNADLIQNLQYLNNLIINNIDPVNVDVLSNKANYIYNYFSLHYWSILCIILGTVSSFLFLLYYFSRSSKIKRITFMLFVLSYIMTSSILFISFQNYNSRTDFQYAIVFDQSIDVNLEPNSNSEVLFKIYEGTKLEIIEDFVNDWLKIKLRDGQIGWIIKNKLKII